MRHLQRLIVSAVLTGLAGHATAADKPVVIAWEQLLPTAERLIEPLTGGSPRGLVEHGQVPLTPMNDLLGDEPTDLPAPVMVTDYDGKRVRLAGFLVPLDFDAEVVKEFLLVPYFGACIHVPPPPANQIVYVTSQKGVKVGDMLDAVWVTGTFTSTQPITTELAEAGYRIAADHVEPYKE